jgi:cytoskeletal protein RodZ
MRQYLFNGRVRTSTLILVGVFIVVFVLYLLVRPDHRTAAQKERDKPRPAVVPTSQTPSPKRSTPPPSKAPQSVAPVSPSASRSAGASGKASAPASAPASADSPGQTSGHGPAQAPAPGPPNQLTPRPRSSR